MNPTPRTSPALVALSSKGSDLDSPLDPILGRSKLFLLVRPGTTSITVIDNSAAEHAPHGAGLHTAETLVKQGVTVVISGDCGPKALKVFQAAGIQVFRAPAGTVKEALASWEAGTLACLT